MSATPSIAQVQRQVHFTGRRHKHGRLNADTIKIARGVHLESEFLRDLETPWAQRRAVEIARVFAVSHLRRASTAVGRSALLLHGLDLPEPLPGENTAKISFTGGRGTSRGALILPAVVLDGIIIAPQIPVTFVGSTHVRTHPVRVHGILAQDLNAAAISTALLSPPRIAFILVSQAYRTILDIFEGERPAPMASDRVRRQSLAALHELPKGRGWERASRILAWADPACESPAEAWLLWNLLRAGVRGVHTQMHVCEAGQRFFVDMALPELRLAIEFDGRGKYGASVQQIHRTIEAERRRERLLVASGWTVIRFDWADLQDPEGLAAELVRIIEARRLALGMNE